MGSLLYTVVRNRGMGAQEWHLELENQREPAFTTRLSQTHLIEALIKTDHSPQLGAYDTSHNHPLQEVNATFYLVEPDETAHL
jgi:hypothetical protein